MNLARDGDFDERVHLQDGDAVAVQLLVHPKI
jgi:hypothetical protein